MRHALASTDDNDLAALLRQVVVELRAIRAAVERQNPASRLSKVDRMRLEQLLLAVANTFGAELFVTRELLAHQAPALREACSGLSARQLGRLLMRADGIKVGAFTVERSGVDAGAVLWRLSGISL